MNVEHGDTRSRSPTEPPSGRANPRSRRRHDSSVTGDVEQLRDILIDVPLDNRRRAELLRPGRALSHSRALRSPPFHSRGAPRSLSCHWNSSSDEQRDPYVLELEGVSSWTRCFPTFALPGVGRAAAPRIDIRDIRLVHGQVPRDLTGVLYRCGPDRQYPSIAKEDCSSMAKVWHTCSALRTVCRLSQPLGAHRAGVPPPGQARRSLFGRYRKRYPNDPSVAGRNMGTANTNIVWHGRKLLALKEDSLPIELDPETLATRGELALRGRRSAVSPHTRPRSSTITRTSCSHSRTRRAAMVRPTSPSTSPPRAATSSTRRGSKCLSRHGALLRGDRFPESSCRSFRSSPTWTFSGRAARSTSGIPTNTAISRSCRGGVLPRRLRWSRALPSARGHMMNAFNEGSLLHLELCLYNGNCFDFLLAVTARRSGISPPQLTPSHLRPRREPRWLRGEVTRAHAHRDAEVR